MEKAAVTVAMKWDRKTAKYHVYVEEGLAHFQQKFYVPIETFAGDPPQVLTMEMRVPA